MIRLRLISHALFHMQESTYCNLAGVGVELMCPLTATAIDSEGHLLASCQVAAPALQPPAVTTAAVQRLLEGGLSSLDPAFVQQ
jgi:hypothetical protein